MLSVRFICKLSEIVTQVTSKIASTREEAEERLKLSLVGRLGFDNGAKALGQVLGAESEGSALSTLRSMLVVHDKSVGLPTSRLENTIVNGLRSGDAGNQPEPQTWKEPRMAEEETKAVRNRIDRTKKIKLKVDANPRKPGSHGHASMEVIFAKPSLTVQEFIDNGGRTGDLAWDIEHGHVELV